MEESKAIALLKKSDLGGLETLVILYQAKAVQAACLIVQDRALAEDIVQKAFITAAEKIHQFDPQRPFKAWFFRSVVNASIKTAIRQKKQSSLYDLIPGQNFTLADILADAHPLPEEWLEIEEHRASIQTALDMLPAEQRAVIVMRYFLELSESEMAGDLKRPPSTIKYWLRSARQQLKQLLTPARGPAPKNEGPIAVPEEKQKEARNEKQPA